MNIYKFIKLYLYLILFSVFIFIFNGNWSKFIYIWLDVNFCNLKYVLVIDVIINEFI